MKSTLLAAALTAGLATAATAQEVPPTKGPYLWAQHETDNVVMLAMGTRRQSGDYWSATSITVFDVAEAGQVRVDAVVEVDCERQVRRTAELHLYSAMDPDAPVGPLTTIPGIDWSPPGPKDGPIMTFVCTGRHDAAQVQDRVSAHVARWRAGG